MGQILCFTLRGQSYIRKVPDPEKAFNMLFLGRVRVHGKMAESDPFPGGMPTLGDGCNGPGPVLVPLLVPVLSWSQSHYWSWFCPGPGVLEDLHQDLGFLPDLEENVVI